MERTNSSGVKSQMSFQSGFLLYFAIMSQSALDTAAVARWITPFSGPSHRCCGSEMTMACESERCHSGEGMQGSRKLKNAPMSAKIESISMPTIRFATSVMAKQTISLPRPMATRVSAKPVWCDRFLTY